MGDRYFDLANLSVNNGFDEADDERLLAAYWGEPCTPPGSPRLRLMRVMSDFREAMWGTVQAVLSELDFDFAGYAREHRARVRRRWPTRGSRAGSRTPVTTPHELPRSARCVIIGGGVMSWLLVQLQVLLILNSIESCAGMSCA